MKPTHHQYNFSPAALSGETIIFGSEKPGYGHHREKIPSAEIDTWLEFMQAQGIKRVCCLLSPAQLKLYETDILAAYRKAFGSEAVLSAPVPDFHLAPEELLTGEILPFMLDADKKQQPVVIHCSAGVGRTGHVLAAWLVCGRGYSVGEALDAVVATGRNPYEAIQTGHASPEQLYDLLAACQIKSSR